MTKEEEEKIHKIVENMSDEEIEDRIRQDEQGEEEAIEIIEKMVKSYIVADECGLSNNDFKHEIKAMQTVLNMLKENSAEIEQKNTELAEKNAEIERLNRQIDLMAEEINETDRGYIDYCQFKMVCDRNCKECIKQYFERKSKK